MSKNCAIIMAGGLASRMKLDRPKSLINIVNESLLEYNIKSMQCNEISNIFVFYNDAKIEDIYRNIIKRYSNVELVQCGYYSSTIMAINEFEKIFSKYDNILFNYGHAPRTTAFLLELIHSTENRIKVSSFTNSTKNERVSINDDFFVEPPYFIDVDLLYKTKCSSWKEFFAKNNNSIKYLYSNAPNEFNYHYEYYIYMQYMVDKFGVLIKAS